jgi:hypothetical protein
MGNIKDRYFKYAENGDQFVGRCLSLLPILNIDLAISPPYFDQPSDLKWIDEMVQVQFHVLKKIPEFGLLLRMCLASLIYHGRWIAANLGPNHVVRNAAVLYRDAVQIKKIEDEKWVIVSYPWTAPKLVFSGIPPYCALLQNIAEVRSAQKSKFFFFYIFKFFID